MEDTGFIDELRALYESGRNARTIRRGRWQLRINEAECNRMFEEITVEADAEVAHSVAGGNTASVYNSM
jgi:hypothetical protein